MDFKVDYKQIEEGFEGENIVRQILIKTPDCSFTQLDMIAKIKGDWYSIEVKHQEYFRSPPFDGHGLPIWQIKKRLELYNDKGIIPLFFVLDKETKLIYYESLLNLEKGKKFKTSKKGRVIYPLESFKIYHYE